MPVDKTDIQQAGRRKPEEDDEEVVSDRTRKKRAQAKGKPALAPLPAPVFKSTLAAVVAVEGQDTKENRDPVANGSSNNITGAARRKQNGMGQAEVVMKLSQKLVKETKKKTVAREKAEEVERAAAASGQAKSSAPDEDDHDDETGPITAGGWLAPETRVMRRKARLMLGVRSLSVEVLEADEIGHISAGKRYVKAGRFSCPRPFGRRLMEDRQELVGILSMPRNKRMRKAGIKETHLAMLADVYKEVMSNALRRKEEDEAIRVGLAPGATGIGLVDKEVRVSLFTMTLGISPFLFMREILWASNHLYAHAVSGEMNRATWIFGCICLCLMSERELLEFLFHTCKVTEMGELEPGELDRLVRGLHLSNDVFWPMFSEQLKEIARAHENGELLITLEYFVGMNHKFPMILYPALHMQELVQRRTLGMHAWGRMYNRLNKYSRYLAKQKAIAEGRLTPCCLWVLLGAKK